LTSSHDFQDEEKALFIDFIRKLLTIDPDHRLTAAQALEHPWILSAQNISEDDLIYPPVK
jgi:serine/threonine protein kinase